MTDVDAVVIGSGAGGLTAAVALQQAGLRTLVLEQHYAPGGWCHSFTLEGHRFSPGVHYVGELGPGGRMRAFYEGLGVSADMEFCELNPDGFDRVRIGAERFDIPKGRGELERRLCDRFTRERAGIRGYLHTVAALSEQLNALFEFRGLLDLLKLPVRAPAVARWGLASTTSLLDRYVRDPLLRAILTAQAGDHGLPPSMAPAPVHASVTAHYFDGGWYPRGGAWVLPRAFIRALTRAGGEIRLETAVARILVEGGRAIGVRLADGQEIRARYVVSNADPGVTFGRLLERPPAAARRKLQSTRWSVSALSLFMATDLDVRALGIDSGNVWSYTNADLERIYRLGMRDDLPEGEVPGLFVTATTLKDPSKFRGTHTLEAFTFLRDGAFRSFAGSRAGAEEPASPATGGGRRPEHPTEGPASPATGGGRRAQPWRPAGYLELKRSLTARMLSAVERVLPGISQRLQVCELGTPLTNLHYCESTEGNLYGTEKSRWQVGPWAWPIRGQMPGLFLCGASTVSHGVLGATISGLMAAREILGVRVSELLQQRGPPLVTLPAEHPEQWPERLRPRAAQPQVKSSIPQQPVA